MVHRYAASTLGLSLSLIAHSHCVAAHRTQAPAAPYRAAMCRTAGPCRLPGILGMLTVTWQLKPFDRALHLIFGLTTLSLLWCCGSASIHHGRSARPDSRAPRARFAGSHCRVDRAVLQIALGGWTSSNYAALACPDLPRCQGAWWPETDYRNAFLLWRGLGNQLRRRRTRESRASGDTTDDRIVRSWRALTPGCGDQFSGPTFSFGLSGPAYRVARGARSPADHRDLMIEKASRCRRSGA